MSSPLEVVGCDKRSGSERSTRARATYQRFPEPLASTTSSFAQRTANAAKLREHPEIAEPREPASLDRRLSEVSNRG